MGYVSGVVVQHHVEKVRRYVLHLRNGQLALPVHVLVVIHALEQSLAVSGPRIALWYSYVKRDWML